MYTIWGRPDCPWCDRAKFLLDAHQLQYEYIELTSDNLEEFSKRTMGAKTVPQIIDDDDFYIGGFEALELYLK